MLKVIIILLFFSFYLPSNSSPKDKIISQMKLTNNLSFNFLQTINDKNEDGKDIIVITIQKNELDESLI